MWPAVSQRWAGGDHHKAQTVGAIWPSLGPSPGSWEEEARGDRGPLYDGCLLEVDGAEPQWTGPLMDPRTKEMDERPPP